MGSILGAALVVVVLVAAGCSADGDTSADDSGESDRTAASSPTDGADADGAAAGGTLERYEGATSTTYADLANWVCHPDATDVCDDGLDATVVAADGTLTEQPWAAAEDPPVDCFYVYPTISRDPGPTSDLVPGDEERFVTLNQAARLGEVCRVFAPVYRQRTLSGLVAGLSGATTTTAPGATPDQPPGPADVREAFAHYMATENDGRGVVLLGHSQGAGVLNGLVAQEVDPDPDVRDVLVAAYLMGASVTVPDGEDVGGDFENIPACRAPEQTGCVLSWATFRSDEPPPPDSFFGRPRSGDGVALCTNPADLAGDGPAEVSSYFPADPSGSILSSPGTDGGNAAWVAPAVGEVTAPFVTTPGLVVAECVERDGFHYLEATVRSDPSDPRADDIGGDITPQWGLHLQDVNLVMGDIVELVRSQSEAHTTAG